MKKSINDYLLDGEIIDAKLQVSNEYIKYHNKLYKLIFIILLFVSLLVSLTGLFSSNNFSLEFIFASVKIFFVMFFIFGLIFLAPFLLFIKRKHYEYYVTNKRVLFFNNKNCNIKEIAYEKISNIKVIKTSFSGKIDNSDIQNINTYNGKYLENIFFYSIDNPSRPVVIFSLLNDANVVMNVINKYKTFSN